MEYTFPSEHKWIEPVTEIAESALGKNNQARLRSFLKKVGSTTVTHTIEPLTKESLVWFTPLYSEIITKKDNPKVFDLYQTTLGKDSAHPYYMLTLSENGLPIGGTIFSERKNILSIAYRIYPHDWNQSSSLQANPALYSEYLINQYAWQRGYRAISHGKDRNPYGLNGGIGLAIFKLSVGCSVYLPSTPYEIYTLNLSEITQDIFLMHLPKHGEQITNATLFTSLELLPKYSAVSKYPDRLQVEIIERKV